MAESSIRHSVSRLGGPYRASLAMSSDSYKLFDTPAFEQIAAAMRAEQQALQLRSFYANLTEVDKRFLKALGIKWSTN